MFGLAPTQVGNRHYVMLRQTVIAAATNRLATPRFPRPVLIVAFKLFCEAGHDDAQLQSMRLAHGDTISPTAGAFIGGQLIIPTLVGGNTSSFWHPDTQNAATWTPAMLIISTTPTRILWQITNSASIAISSTLQLIIEPAPQESSHHGRR